MNPIPYIKGFAWISMIALCLLLFTGFWLPMLIGMAVVMILLMLIQPRRS